MEKVSIIIPVYKVEEYLPETIESVLGQTYKNIEIILVDDGSPDNCPQLCDNYARGDVRFVVVHKENGGLSSARNTGVKVATGKYIMFLDSDDLYDPTMVEILVKLKQTTDASLVACEFQRFADGTHDYRVIEALHHPESQYSLEGIAYYKKLISRQIDCSVCNKLFDKSMLEGHLFREGRNNEDYLFLFELHPYIKTVAYTNQCYYRYRIRENSITRSSLNPHTFDVLDNIIEIEERIINDSLDLKNEIREYKNLICMQLLVFIYKNSLKKQCQERYAYCKKQVRKNIVHVLFSNSFTLKEKAKFVFAAIA